LTENKGPQYIIIHGYSLSLDDRRQVAEVAGNMVLRLAAL